MNFRCSPFWYAGVTIFFSAALLLLIQLIPVLNETKSEIDYSLFGKWEELPKLGKISTYIFLTAVIGFGEESGWRGFLQPYLRIRLGYPLLIIISFLLWSSWHLPLFFFDPYFSAMAPERVAGWFFFTLKSTVLFTWIYERSKALIIPVLAHGTLDYFMGSEFIKQGELYIPVLFIIMSVTIYGAIDLWHMSRMKDWNSDLKKIKTIEGEETL